MNSPQGPTTEWDGASTGRHHFNRPTAFGVADLTKVRRTPAGDAGSHADLTVTIAPRAAADDVTDATIYMTRSGGAR